MMAVKRKRNQRVPPNETMDTTETPEQRAARLKKTTEDVERREQFREELHDARAKTIRGVK